MRLSLLRMWRAKHRLGGNGANGFPVAAAVSRLLLDCSGWLDAAWRASLWPAAAAAVRNTRRGSLVRLFSLPFMPCWPWPRRAKDQKGARAETEEGNAESEHPKEIPLPSGHSQLTTSCRTCRVGVGYVVAADKRDNSEQRLTDYAG